MGAVARRRDDLFRLRRSRDRQIQEVARRSPHAHELGMVTVLWCYLRNNAFKTSRGKPTTTSPPT